MSGEIKRNSDPIFHRDPSKSYPVIARAEGAYVYDATGKRYLDAAGGVFVVNIGHGVPEVIEAMSRQARKVTFAHTAYFTTEAEQDFARKLVALAPPGFSKAWICTSGSQANETAVKLARTYHLLGREPARVQVFSRWNSYHGSSLGALALTGHTARREPYVPYLFPSPKIEPPYCYRCPFGQTYPDCGLACADALENTIRRIGVSNISAFIAEPVSGGPLGALVPPEGYFRKLRDICDRHGVLLILDEVITGAGRTGSAFGFDHFDVVPDIITLAKGIGGGYVPIGAVLVHDRIIARFEEAGEPFRHGETFTGQAFVSAVGSAVLDHLARNHLIDRARETGGQLGMALAALKSNPHVGDVRGLGMLWGIELVEDKPSKRPFARARRIAEAVADAAMQDGLITIAGTGCADGLNGDTISLSPPFILADEDIASIPKTLARAIDMVTAQK
jgi:adenosylmethionine-8-amino-7-oxononanoate aminotransferase